MNIGRRILTSALATLLTLSITAQEKDMRAIYNQAEEEYNIGRFEEARDLLKEHLSNFKGNILESAYRLMSLCYLADDHNEEAERYAGMLLTQSPYYTVSAQDPMRFAEIVEQIKKGRSTTFTTASSQEESLGEVPVPATLITEEMIRNSGARNLQELLEAYVPGMHIVDCNDDINIAMRGIYSNGQEKILIMLNGHRLNSYCTNIASPDFSIGLEKLTRIEVLRGPASSLYGGVALTAVVNLITKQGAELDGIEARAGIGNYGQLRGALTFGKRYFDLDLLIWGSIYKNSGESRTPEQRTDEYGTPVPYVTIGHIGEKPSYDFGVQMNWKNLRFLYDTHFSQIVSPYTISTLATTYDRERYRTFNGIRPSFSTNAHHAEIGYGRKLGSLNLQGSLTYDNSDLTHYQVIYDGNLPEFGTALNLPQDLRYLFQKYSGMGRYINGQDYSYGAEVKGDYTYIKQGPHKGSITFGAQYSHFRLEDVRYQVVYDFTSASPEMPSLQEGGKGRENSYNAFIQLKHQWHSLILNAGLRYDHKLRYDSTKLDVFSPRVALILLKPKWNVKLSYSKAFVDAPYLYRKSNSFLRLLENDMSVDIEEELSPETAHSFQLTFAANGWARGLNVEVNTFYNILNDPISTNVMDYQNGGQNRTVGAELMASYSRSRFTADFNFSWIKVLKSNPYNVTITGFAQQPGIDSNRNTPVAMANAVLAWEVSQRLKFTSHINFKSKQETYNADIVKIAQANKEMEEASKYPTGDPEWIRHMQQATTYISQAIYKGDMDPRVIVDLGAEYKLNKLTFGLNVHNLFNTKYNQSGSNTKLIPQKGLWFMASVAYKF